MSLLAHSENDLASSSLILKVDPRRTAAAIRKAFGLVALCLFFPVFRSIAAEPDSGEADASTERVASTTIIAGPFTNPANGHRYSLLAVNAWLTAELRAQQLEGHLAIIDDAQENEWIAARFRPYETRAWIGLHDALVEGQERTVDGRPVGYTHFAVKGGGNTEALDFVEMDLASGLWSFRSSLVTRAAIIEVAPTPDVLAGPIHNASTGSDYYLLSDASWKRAEEKALQLGGHLVTIGSASENAWVLAQFGQWDRDQPIWLWIGLTDQGTEGVYQWANGEPVTYLNWGNGQPDDNNGVEDYVHTWPDGRWNDLTNIASSDVGGLWLGVVEVPPAGLRIRMSEVELSWWAALGRQYQVQQRALGSGSAWTDVGPRREGTGAQLVVKVPVEPGNPASLFRLVEMP